MSGMEKLPAAHAGASVWEIAGSELRLNLRSAGFRVVGALLVLVSILSVVTIRYAEPGLFHVGPSAGEDVRETLEVLLLTLAPLLAGGAALRERTLGMDDLVLSKPPSSETLAWGKFLGIFGALLALIPVAVLFEWAAQLVLLPPEHALLPLIVGGLRVAPPLLFLTGVTFALALFSGSPMVAGLVVAMQVGAGMGASYFVPALRWTLTPYHLCYGLLGLALVAAIAGHWEHRREPEARLPRSWGVGLACLVLSLAAGGIAVRNWRGWTFQTDPALEALEAWAGKKGDALPDARARTLSGGTVRLSDWAGKPVVVVFWSSPGSACEAAALEQAWREAAGGRVGFIPVCVTGDPGGGRDLARAAGLRTPAIWNPPAAFGTASGLAARFGVETAPRAAAAAVIAADGSAGRGTLPVSQFPVPPRGRPPRRDWERQLVDLGRTAFRQLAERGP